MAKTDAAGAGVKVERYATNEVVVGVTSAAGGLLVLSDTYYPGWNAYVDGIGARVYRANLSQRAVVVGPGTHRVEFKFESRSIRWGLAVSVASLLALGVLIVRARRLAQKAGGALKQPSIG